MSFVVDWQRVEVAMERGKRGFPSPGDTELCTAAFRSDPKEYGRRKQLVDEAVLRDEQERWRAG